MNVLDKLFPFLVGNRTQILGAVYFIFRALAAFGVIPNHVANQAGELIRPAALATLAAKLQGHK